MALALAALLAASPACAEVVSANANGFHLRYNVESPGTAEEALLAFARVDRWWNPAHTYSGQATSISMQLTPGGCLCEELPGGGIEHMRVTYMDIPKRLVLTGALGPLLYEAATGVMDLNFEGTPGGGARTTVDYKVAGFASGGAEKLAPLVDKVLADQMQRYGAFARTR
jgi:hypothetical protein